MTARALFRLAILAALQLASSGCAHEVEVRTRPAGANVKVMGQDRGQSPVVMERRTGLGGHFDVTAELPGFEPSTVRVERTELYAWPSLLAATPLLGLAALFVPPPAGPVICGVWTIATLPMLGWLCAVQSYPQEIVVDLSPKMSVDGDGPPVFEDELPHPLLELMPPEQAKDADNDFPF